MNRPAAVSVDQAPLRGRAQRAWQESVLKDLGKGPENALVQALLHFAMGKADCFPSVAKLAEMSGKAERTVIRLIAKAIDKGVVVVVEDGSIATHRRFVFPSHPNAPAVLEQFPRYVRGCQNVTPPPTCRGDKNGTCRGDKNGTCRGDILSPELEFLSQKGEAEDSSKPPLPPTPAQHARETADLGGCWGVVSPFRDEAEEAREAFVEFIVSRPGWGDMKATARRWAAGVDAGSLAEARRGVESGAIRNEGTMTRFLDHRRVRPALTPVGAAGRPPPDEDDDIPY